uniref:Uncharacterized protein n=1 Tax=Anguilla anguilla TaxID=7936 RepID=A0A0E9UM96_ANGAN
MKKVIFFFFEKTTSTLR